MGEFLYRKAGVLLLLTQPNGVDMYDFDGPNSNKAGEIQVMSFPCEALKRREL